MSRPPVHGQSNSPTYRSWRAMITRCYNPKNHNYPRYGGRGIEVCARWRWNFQAFLDDMGSRPSLDHTIDRIILDGDYEPSNCRWATKIEQGNNHSKNHHVMYRGRKMTMTQAWRESGQIIPKSTLKSRLYVFGWPIEKALETPAIMGRNQWGQTNAAS